MTFDPSNPVQCTLPKHVSMEILHREIPVKKLYFPVRDCSVYVFFCNCKVYGARDIYKANSKKSHPSLATSVVPKVYDFFCKIMQLHKGVGSNVNEYLLEE